MEMMRPSPSARPRPSSTRARHAAMLALATLLAATGCQGIEDCACAQPVPRLTLTPTSLTASVGDTVAVRLDIDEPPRANSTVRWQSSRPEVVRIDTTVAPGRPALARAVAPGAAVLTATLFHDGQAITASVPATVVTR